MVGENDGEAQALGGESTDLDSSQDTADTVELLAAKATLAQHILTLKNSGVDDSIIKLLAAGGGGEKKSVKRRKTTHTDYEVKVPIPEMVANMNFEDFVDLVDKWKATTEVPANKQAMLLVMKLPLQDSYGGIRRVVNNKFSNS